MVLPGRLRSNVDKREEARHGIKHLMHMFFLVDWDGETAGICVIRWQSYMQTLFSFSRLPGLNVRSNQYGVIAVSEWSFSVDALVPLEGCHVWIVIVTNKLPLLLSVGSFYNTMPQSQEP